MTPPTLPNAKVLLSRLQDYVWDNPTAEHDARAILSSPKVGLWLGIEITLITLACAFTAFVLPETERELRNLASHVGAGTYLIATTLIILTIFLTLVVPLRASGLLEGPRWRGYMDQLVTTGVSPLRYFAGKWATSQIFFLTLLLASIPFVVLFGLLSDVSWSWTLTAYLVLYAYCNLLLIVTFGLGIVLHESMAILLTWLLFALFILVDFWPVPSCLAVMTPIRFLIQPFVEIVSGSGSAIVAPIYGAAQPYGFTLPWPVWAMLVWGTVASMLSVTCLLGPLHAFVPGMNNFGAVVLPGDHRRVFFSRLRPFLTRRVELAFLFENRGPRLVRWTLPLRSLQQFLFLSLLTSLLFAAVFDASIVGILPREGLVASHGFATSLVLVISTFVFASGRSDALQRFNLGPFSIPQAAFDAATFVCFLGVLFAVHGIGFSVAWSTISQSPVTPWTRLSPQEAFSNASSNLAVLSTVAISTFLFLKVVGSRVLSRSVVFVAGVLYLLAIFLIPLVGVGMAEALRTTDLPYLVRLATPCFVLAEISPGLQMAIINDAAPRWLDTSNWLVERAFWIWHAGLIASFLPRVWASHRSLAREAAVHAGEGTGVPRVDSAPPPPCSVCRSLRRVPAGWTPSGGILGTKFWGTVRCVDCHAEYSPKTGFPDHRARFSSLAFRAAVTAVSCGLVGWALVEVTVP